MYSYAEVQPIVYNKYFMKIIKDEQRQINLHPLVIYFVLSSKDSKERAEALSKLNKYQGFTRGIFKFQTIEHVEKYSEEVSSELTDDIKHYNMFVRLVDDNSDAFYYAVHKVNFNLSADEVEYSIQRFIVEVCKQNIKQLASRDTEYSLHGVSPEKQMAVRQMQQSFREAMTLKGYKHGLWARLMGEEILETRPIASITKDGNAREMPKGFTEKFEKAAKNNNPQYLWSWLESMTGAPGKEESDEIAKGYYNKKYAPSLKRDQRRRTQPKEKPAISVELKHIVKTMLKSGREKKEYGFVFTVNDEVFPVCFGSKDQTMLYACTLLRQKMGEKMYLHEFFNNSKGCSSKAKFKRGKSEKWLKAVYEAIFPNDAREFSDWIGKVRETRGRPLNQGKSQSSKRIEEIFDSQSSAIYFCSVNTREDEIGDSFYDIKIPAEKITIPENMQFLIDEFNDLMGI